MRLLISVFLLGFCLFQAKTQIIKEIRISKAVDPIILDGLLNEVSWQNADVGCDYYQNFPTDTVMATAKTELRFTYDDKFIYVAGKMYNTGTANYVTPSLRRDFRGAGNDMLTIAFDTFNDRTNAFQFGMNPFGVRREGLVSNGGAERGNLSLDWENK